MEEKIGNSLFFNLPRARRVLQLYLDDVDFVGTPAIKNDGRDTPVVFVFSAVGGHHRLLTLAVQVDTLILDDFGSGVHLRQPFQTRDTLQDVDACITKPLVCTSRHRIYVCLCHLWSSYIDGWFPARQAEKS